MKLVIESQLSIHVLYQVILLSRLPIMPKKRTANATTSKASQPRAGPDYTWIHEVQDLTSSAQLQQEYLERAIGLTSSRSCVNKLALDVANLNRVDEVEDEEETDEEDPIALSDTINLDSDGDDPISSFPEPTTLDDHRKRPRPKQRVYGKAQNQNKNKRSKTTTKTSSASGNCSDTVGTCSVAGCRENLRCLNYMGGKVVSLSHVFKELSLLKSRARADQGRYSITSDISLLQTVAAMTMMTIILTFIIVAGSE